MIEQPFRLIKPRQCGGVHRIPRQGSKRCVCCEDCFLHPRIRFDLVPGNRLAFRICHEEGIHLGFRVGICRWQLDAELLCHARGLRAPIPCKRLPLDKTSLQVACRALCLEDVPQPEKQALPTGNPLRFRSDKATSSGDRNGTTNTGERFACCRTRNQNGASRQIRGSLSTTSGAPANSVASRRLARSAKTETSALSNASGSIADQVIPAAAQAGEQFVIQRDDRQRFPKSSGIVHGAGRHAQRRRCAELGECARYPRSAAPVHTEHHHRVSVD